MPNLLSTWRDWTLWSEVLESGRTSLPIHYTALCYSVSALKSVETNTAISAAIYFSNRPPQLNLIAGDKLLLKPMTCCDTCLPGKEIIHAAENVVIYTRGLCLRYIHMQSNIFAHVLCMPNEEEKKCCLADCLPLL